MKKILIFIFCTILTTTVFSDWELDKRVAKHADKSTVIPLGTNEEGSMEVAIASIKGKIYLSLKRSEDNPDFIDARNGKLIVRVKTDSDIRNGLINFKSKIKKDNEILALICKNKNNCPVLDQMLDGHTLAVVYRSKTVNSKKILTPVSIPLESYKETLIEFMQAE